MAPRQPHPSSQRSATARRRGALPSELGGGCRSRRRRLLSLGWLVVFLPPAAFAGAGWEAACSGPEAMPELSRTVAPVPSPGKWRGRGFGDTERFDVEIEECGMKVLGLAGVSFHLGTPPVMLPLVRDDSGNYEASFTYAEGGAAVVVTWDLQAESESRITGHMSIMGRRRPVYADLLEAKPNVELAACACQAVQDRRARLAESAESAEGAPGSFWETDPESCALREVALEESFPTRASLEVAARADFQGELVHQRRCCAVSRAGSDYSGWQRSSDAEHAADVRAANTTEIESLDTWLNDHCPEDDAAGGR